MWKLTLSFQKEEEEKEYIENRDYVQTNQFPSFCIVSFLMVGVQYFGLCYHKSFNFSFIFESIYLGITIIALALHSILSLVMKKWSFIYIPFMKLFFIFAVFDWIIQNDFSADLNEIKLVNFLIGAFYFFFVFSLYFVLPHQNPNL